MHAFICDAVRTPIGRYGGVLSAVRADDLAAVPIAALMARNPGVDWEKLDDLVMGCANQAGEDNRNVARMAGLLAGLPEAVPGVTINRLCASGMDAVGMVARAVRAGDYDMAIAGGVESMSRAPLVMAKAEVAFSRRAEVYDTTIGWRFVNPKMQDGYGTASMPETADNVAKEFSISRADQDGFAARSQARCAQAQAGGVFDNEIVPVSVPQRRGDAIEVARDEHPRPEISVAKLAALKGINGAELSVTAGNASGINDGAATLVLARADMAKKAGLEPKARIIAYAHAGVRPDVMGIGPVPAVEAVLKRTGLSVGDFDVIESNEAFAAQAVAVNRGLGLDAAKVNPNGGAIALGHPVGATGAIITIKALVELERTGGQRALITMCIGGGQGIALAIERI